MAQVTIGASNAHALADGLDGVILKQNLTSNNGVALDATGFAPAFIRTGHPVIYNPSVANSHKPYPLNAGGTALGTMPADHVFYGVVVNSVMKQGNAFAVGVCLRGEVNPAVKNVANGVYGIETTVLTAIKTALPLIIFRKDNE